MAGQMEGEAPLAEEKERVPTNVDVALVRKLISDFRAADRDGISVQKMVSFLTSFPFLPHCEGFLYPGTLIGRARINSGPSLFCSEKELSYHPKADECKRYGRASTPLRAVFYGSIMAGLVEDRVLTLMSEVAEVFKNGADGKYDMPSEFFLTVGTWSVTEKITVAEMVYAQRFINASPEIRKAFEHFMRSFAGKIGGNELEATTAILEFICEEFANPHVARHEDYVVSAAYAQMLLETTPRVQGILYPSVRSDARGFNVALYPYTVERSLVLIEAAYCRVSEAHTPRPVFQVLKIASDLGPVNSRFTWVDVPSKGGLRA
jgi:hypothetical protein